MSDWVFLQANVDVHDRIAAMRGDYDDGSRTMEFLIAAGAFVVIFGSLFYVYRQLSKRIHANGRERAEVKAPWAENQKSTAEIREEMLRKLADVQFGAGCWLFWSEGGRRRRVAAKFESVSSDRVVLALKGGPQPEGDFRLVTPTTGGRGTQFEMTVRPGGAGGKLSAAAREGEAALEIVENARARTGLKAAAAPAKAKSGDDAFALRVIDLSQSGIGVLCDHLLPVDGRYRVKVALPDRDEKLSLDVVVAWAEEGTGGIHRGGFNIESRDFAQDALVSDFLREEARRGPAAVEGDIHAA